MNHIVTKEGKTFFSNCIFSTRHFIFSTNDRLQKLELDRANIVANICNFFLLNSTVPEHHSLLRKSEKVDEKKRKKMNAN